MKKIEIFDQAGLRITLAFTLVEVLIVMGMVAFLAMMVIANLNPIALFDKARDAERKKDLSRVKTAFEEFYNDHGSYVNASGIYKNGKVTNYKVENLNSGINCNKSIFGPYLNSWPCDPKGVPYSITRDPLNNGKENNYMVCTMLENIVDKDIPPSKRNIKNVINYCVSSENVDWKKIISL